MRNGSAILVAIVLLAIAGTIWQRYDQYVLKGNFYLEAYASCDPATEMCFVADCPPEEDLECDASPYKKIEMVEREAPKCLEEHTCDTFSCPANSGNCSVTYCSEDTLDEGEVCLEQQDEIPAPEEHEESVQEENL